MTHKRDTCIFPALAKLLKVNVRKKIIYDKKKSIDYIQQLIQNTASKNRDSDSIVGKNVNYPWLNSRFQQHCKIKIKFWIKENQSI